MSDSPAIAVHCYDEPFSSGFAPRLQTYGSKLLSSPPQHLTVPLDHAQVPPRQSQKRGSFSSVEPRRHRWGLMFVFLSSDIYNTRKACHETPDGSIVLIGTSIPRRCGERTALRIPCGRATVGPRPSTLEARHHRHHQPPRLADHHRVHERSDRGVADLRRFGQEARHPRCGPAWDGWQQLGTGGSTVLIWVKQWVPSLVGPRFHRSRLGSTGHAGDRPGSKPIHPRQQIGRDHRSHVPLCPLLGTCLQEQGTPGW